MSWRRAWIGGGLAVGGFVLLVGAYMVLRAMGIGPAGSLLAAGALGENEKILVADLHEPRQRLDARTRRDRCVPHGARPVAERDGRAAGDGARRAAADAADPTRRRVDFALAREIATREGIKAVIDGSLLGVGGRYVIAMRLVSAQSGDELATFRETADDQSEILPTVDRLAKEVRAKIGESLKHVQSAPPLEQVTTPSLDALKKYVQG